MPKPTPVLSSHNHLKRKTYVNECSLARKAYRVRYSGDHSQASNKKTKKGSVAKSAAANALDPNDAAALHRRAARFQREHEIERQKSSRQFNNHNSSRGPYTNPQLFKSRSGTPAAYDADNPDADPVRPLPLPARRSLLSDPRAARHRTCRTGTGSPSWARRRRYSRTTCG